MFRINKFLMLLMLYAFSMGMYAASDLALNSNEIASATGDMGIAWEAAQAQWLKAKEKNAEIKQETTFMEKEKIKDEAALLMIECLKLLPVYVKNDSFFNKIISYSVENKKIQRVVTTGDFLYLGTGFGGESIQGALYGSMTTSYGEGSFKIAFEKIINQLLALTEFNQQAIIIKLENLASPVTILDGVKKLISKGQNLLTTFALSTINNFSHTVNSDEFRIETAPNIEIIFQNMNLENVFMRPNQNQTLNEAITLLFPRTQSRGRDFVKAAASIITTATSSNDTMSLETASYILGLMKDPETKTVEISREEVNTLVESYSTMLREFLTVFNIQKLKSVEYNINKMIDIIQLAGSRVLRKK